MAGPYVITTPVQGQPIPSVGFGQAVKNAINDLDSRALALETGSQSFIKRGRRNTSTGNVTTTETGILRIDNVPVRAGSIYQISTGELNLDTDVVGTIGTAKARAFYQATTGGVCTVANGTQFGLFRAYQDDATQSNVGNLSCVYIATADGYISVLLTIVRQGGTGNVVAFASSGEPLDLFIQYGGSDPGDTGVVL